MTAGRSNEKRMSVDWCTPLKYVNAVTDFFSGPPSLDPCSNEFSTVNAQTNYLLPLQDGLKLSWNYPTIYVNPPYGSDKIRNTRILDWFQKCVEANMSYESEILALVPVATNTRHWKECVWPRATGVCFLFDTRLKFCIDGIEDTKGAPMACAIVYWGDNFWQFENIFVPFGAVLHVSSWGIENY